MWSIANRYNTTVAILKELNNLNTNLLQVGQVLKLPSGGTTSSNQSGNTYTVQSGDSLWSIANRYNTTVAILKELNNLNTNSLQVGQVLKLPSGDTTNDTQSGNIYTVQSGDTIFMGNNVY